jgi:hypothetical protein
MRINNRYGFFLKNLGPKAAQMAHYLMEGGIKGAIKWKPKT